MILSPTAILTFGGIADFVMLILLWVLKGTKNFKLKLSFFLYAVFAPYLYQNILENFNAHNAAIMAATFVPTIIICTWILWLRKTLVIERSDAAKYLIILSGFLALWPIQAISYIALSNYLSGNTYTDTTEWQLMLIVLPFSTLTALATYLIATIGLKAVNKELDRY